MMAFPSCSGTAHSGGGNCQARTIARFLYITAGMTRAQPGPLVTASPRPSSFSATSECSSSALAFEPIYEHSRSSLSPQLLRLRPSALFHALSASLLSVQNRVSRAQEWPEYLGRYMRRMGTVPLHMPIWKFCAAKVECTAIFVGLRLCECFQFLVKLGLLTIS